MQRRLEAEGAWLKVGRVTSDVEAPWISTRGGGGFISSGTSGWSSQNVTLIHVKMCKKNKIKLHRPVSETSTTSEITSRKGGRTSGQLLTVGGGSQRKCQAASLPVKIRGLITQV